MPTALSYIPGKITNQTQPLARFLPPLPDGIISRWLVNNISKGSRVIDPFGASPHLVVEAAHAGYQVIVAVNNPVARFLLENAANRPIKADLRAAVAELASAHHGDVRIEPYILSLYQTNCAACGHQIIADAFLWERDADAPYARIYHCQYCGDNGEHPVNESDLQLAAQFTGSNLHRARALERVALSDDPDRIYVEEALSHYLPRAVFSLFTLINRLDGLSISDTRRQHLQMLLLQACDIGNTLWAVPTSRPRPRQLATPSRFREANIWFALEQGINIYGEQTLPNNVPLVYWPAEPPKDGGISLYEGRLRDLVDSFGDQDIRAVITAIPRYNQAYWTLSALWAGWLWGREAVGPFKMVLRRRAYDWAWHTTALYMTLNHLSPMLKPGTPFFGLLGEAEPGFLTASLAAGDAAGFALEGLALREDHQLAQIFWKQNIQKDIKSAHLSPEQLAVQSIRAYLSERGEPASYLTTFTAGLQGLAEHRIHWLEMKRSTQVIEKNQSSTTDTDDINEEQQPQPRPHRLYSTTTATIRMALTNKSEFTNFRSTDKQDLFEGSEKAPMSDSEAGSYWLYETRQTNLSLADRVEMALVKILTREGNYSFSEVQESLFVSFPGLLTPGNDILHVCLESYSESVPEHDNQWRLREQDHPARRRKDLIDVRDTLTTLGERLGYSVREMQIKGRQNRLFIGWFDAFEQPAYWFCPIASAVLSDIILNDGIERGEKIIVLPGSRANLVIYKLRHDPRLSEHCVRPTGWRFLKFRHLRWQLENPLLTRESLSETLELDPLTYSTPQLRLL